MGHNSKAIVLGGGNDQISLILELKNRGFGEIILVDYLQTPIAKKYSDRHYVTSTLDIDEVLRITRKESPALVVTACTDQALGTMSYVAEKLGLPNYISYQTAKSLTNKAYMKEIFKKNNIPTANFLILKNSSKIEQKLTFPMVIKPSDCNSSVGISKIYNYSQFENAFKEAHSLSRSGLVIIEEFIEGEEYSVDAFVNDGLVQLISITKLKKINNLNRFTIVQSELVSDMPKGVIENLQSIIQRISDSFELKNTPMLIQTLINEEKINVIEFSARIGGGSKHHFIKHVKGYDIMNAYLDALLDNKKKYNIKNTIKYASMNYVYIRSGVFMNHSNLDILKDDKLILDYYQYKAFGSEVKKATSSSDRVLGFLVIADSEEEHKYKINKIDESIKVLDEKGDDIMMHGLYN